MVTVHILVARITSISNSISKEFMVINALDGRELPLFYVQVFDESRDLEFMVLRACTWPLKLKTKQSFAFVSENPRVIGSYYLFISKYTHI